MFSLFSTGLFALLMVLLSAFLPSLWRGLSLAMARFHSPPPRRWPSRLRAA